MAATSFLAALLRKSPLRNPRTSDFRSLPFSLFENPNPRFFSSNPSRSEGLVIEEESSSPSFATEEDLRSRIFRLRFPKRSATAAIEKWVAEGRKVKQSELREIAKELRRSQRYKHALEILTWMGSQGSFQITAADHATRLDLIIKVWGLAEAEAFFEKLSTSASQKLASFPLLHYYVKERNLEKAEALMLRLHNSGLAVDPHLFNEMMKLYMSTGQSKKVLAVIRHMKLSNIPLNVLSYNLWLNASAEVSSVSSVEMVYKEMDNDKNVEVGWSVYSTLANIYTKSNLFDKASAALRIAEKKLSARKRLAYYFIMTNYTALGDRNGVRRLWESSKRVQGRITCANYMCAMLCLIKVGDIKEAENIFREWELECRNYDIRVSNVLLGAYMRNGWMDKAESLHLYTLERGAIPNYKTWEILMEGWVKKGQMDRAIEAMKKGFSMLNGCIWRPPSNTLMAIAEYFEKQGSVKDMEWYVNVLQGLNLMSLTLYKSFIRAHINARRAAPNILQMMKRDNIELDEEIRTLIEYANEPSNHLNYFCCY